MKVRYRKLDIDFRRSAHSSPWASRVLLLLAAAVSLDAGLAYRDARGIIERNREALARAPAAPASPASKEDVALARDTVERLAMPWGSLFGALESASSEQIAVLGVEPDAKAGKVLISGEGKDYLATLTYVLNLSRSPALSAVQLVRHETKSDDPQRPVAFAVSAKWKEGER